MKGRWRQFEWHSREAVDCDILPPSPRLGFAFLDRSRGYHRMIRPFSRLLNLRSSPALPTKLRLSCARRPSSALPQPASCSLSTTSLRSNWSGTVPSKLSRTSRPFSTTAVMVSRISSTVSAEDNPSRATPPHDVRNPHANCRQASQTRAESDAFGELQVRRGLPLQPYNTKSHQWLGTIRQVLGSANSEV